MLKIIAFPSHPFAFFLLPVICFKLPITRTLFDFPWRFRLSEAYCIYQVLVFFLMKRNIILKSRLWFCSSINYQACRAVKMLKYFPHVTCVLLRGYVLLCWTQFFLLFLLLEVVFISCCRYQFSSISVSNLSFTTTIITVCLINSTIVFLLVRPWGWPYYNYLKLTLTPYCCGGSLLAPTSPRCFLSVSFSLSRKPQLLSIWSYMYLVNKNYGKDYPLAREDIHAANTYMMRWFHWYIRFGVMSFSSPVDCSLINGPFLRSSENSRFACNNISALENGFRLGFVTLLHSVALSIVLLIN